MVDVILPRLDQDMEEGLLAEWLVDVGDRVEADTPIAVVETEKVATEIEATTSGTVSDLLVAQGERHPVGTVIARIGSSEDETESAVVSSNETREPTEDSSQARPAEGRPEALESEQIPHEASSASKGSAGQEVFRAPTRGVKLPKNRDGWTRPHADSPRLRSRTEENQPPRDQGSTPGLPASRAAAAKRVEQSWRIPQFWTETKLRVRDLRGVIATLRRAGHGRATITDLLLAAVAEGCEHHPQMNGWLLEEGIVESQEFRPTLMVAGTSVVVPVCLGPLNGLSVKEISHRRSSAVERARSGRLEKRDRERGSISLSNLGMSCVDRFNALLMPPQIAVCAFGRVNSSDDVDVISMVTTVDHRALDGWDVAQFHETISEYLSDPYGSILSSYR